MIISYLKLVFLFIAFHSSFILFFLSNKSFQIGQHCTHNHELAQCGYSDLRLKPKVLS